MSHVYVLINSDTDIHVFDKEEHLLLSVYITYSWCSDVNIVEAPFDPRYVTFTVTGTKDKQSFNDTITFHRLAVWNEPSHL
jgi:hypothetical protein